jgi:hypothetical protein
MVAAATIVLGTAVMAPAAHAAGVPTVVNGAFTQTNSSGFPTGWGSWNPAGSAIVAVTPGAAPGGLPALSITSTSGSTARLALTQRVTVPAGAPRQLTLTALVKGENLGTGTGFSYIRVQARNAANAIVMPVQNGPYLRGTFDWQEVEYSFTLPDNATSISVEPMLDRAPGTLSVANIQIVEDQAPGSLTATPTDSGTVELNWAFPSLSATSYSVERASAGVPATEIRRTTVPTVGDENVEPATAYTYVVHALGADGAVLASTPEVSVSTPATFDLSFERTIVVAGETAAGAVRVSWALASDAPRAELTLVAGAVSMPVSGVRGSVTLTAAPGETVVLRSGDQQIGAAVIEQAAHPRSIMTDEAVAQVQAALASGAPTATGAWNGLVERLATGTGYIANGSGGFYEARDAAFAYAVTGDPAFAQQAYAAAKSAEAYIVARDFNMGLELARPAVLLPNVYDWAYNGWTVEQREEIRVLMLRVSELLSTYHHNNIDGPDFSSNWAGIVRSSELALLLALRGDEGTPDLDRRILSLADMVGQHFDDAYTDTGWSHEGWDYLHYTQLFLFPAMFFAQGAGLTSLDDAFERPDFANLALHVVSSRELGDVGQYGTAGPNREVLGTFPLLYPLADDGQLPGLMHLHDRVHGVDSVAKSFDNAHGLWTVLYYPTDGTAAGAPISESAERAILDDEGGFYAFRNRFENADDTIVVTSNRNLQHPQGWAAAETFSLSWLGHDTTWGLLGGKDQNPLMWSKPLVDGKLERYENQYRTVDGRGVTLDSRAFTDQGGGYLSLDGSKNFEVDRALRQQVVDLTSAEHQGGASAIVAINDSFGDDVSHRWDWQLRPQAGVTISVDTDSTESEPLFTFTSTDAAGAPVVLSGFVLDREGLTAQVIGGTLRLSREGTEASFKLVLATAAEALTATVVGDTVIVSGAVAQLDDLSTAADCGLPRLPAGAVKDVGKTGVLPALDEYNCKPKGPRI